MLDVRRLHMLRELSERGTIAATAGALGYSAPAVSQHLAALERQVGVALLERQGRRVVHTPAARLLVGRTERVLAELEAAEAELATGNGEVRSLGDNVTSILGSAVNARTDTATASITAVGGQQSGTGQPR